jgi:AraC-like DNA-binding protein
MTKAGGFIPRFQISTDDLPEKHRLAIWTEEICRRLLRLDFSPIPDVPFKQTATMRRLPGLSMVAGESSGCMVSHTKHHIAEDGDGLTLYIHLAGALSQCQKPRQEETIAAGQAAVLLNGAPGSLVMSGPCRGIIARVPGEALAGRLPVPYAAVLHKLPQNSEALRLLAGYLSHFDAACLDTGADTRALSAAFVNHVHDLLALALRPSRDTWERSTGGLRAARLHAIKSDIFARLAQSDLSVNSVAALQGVSPRYVQRLFEEEGTSFTAFVQNARLAQAHRVLSDPFSARLTIAAIAYEAGFPDLSNFNRFFRRRYGVTPSDVRAAAKNGG